MSRESRLLLVTLVVSGVVLLVLAQLRFPEAPPVIPTTPPLERLAARASFADLATKVAEVEALIRPNLLTLRLGSSEDPAPERLDDLLGRWDVLPGDVRHVPALRLDATTAVAAVPGRMRVTGIVGGSAQSGTAAIVATDPLRGIARIRVPAGPMRPQPQEPLTGLVTPTYVIAVEGTHAGISARPVFLGHSERFASWRWSRPLLPLGGIVVAPGALIFTLDGEILGAAVAEDGVLAIAAAADVVDAANALQQPGPPLVDPGITVQPLTAALAAATGASMGALVAEVDPEGIAAGVLEPGDVITSVAGEAIDAAEGALVRLGAGLARGPVAVTMVRDGASLSAELRAAEAPAVSDGIVLDTIRRTGAVVRSVEPGSPFAIAGLRAADVITRAGSFVAPTVPQVRNAITSAGEAPVLLLVRRDGRQFAIAVQVPSSDVAR